MSSVHNIQKMLAPQCTVDDQLLTFRIVCLTGSRGFCPRPASREGTLLHIASPGTDQISKCEVQFLLNVHHFCIIIKSTSHKLNHPESGSVCTYHFGFQLAVNILVTPHQARVRTFKATVPYYPCSVFVPLLFRLAHNRCFPSSE